MAKPKEPPIGLIVTTLMIIVVTAGAVSEILRSLQQTVDFMTLALRGTAQGIAGGVVVQFFQQYAVLRFNRAKGRKWMWVLFFCISLGLDAMTNVGEWTRTGIPPTSAGQDAGVRELAIALGFVWCFLVCFFEEFVSGMVAIVFHNINEIIVGFGGDSIKWLEWAEELARDLTPGTRKV